MNLKLLLLILLGVVSLFNANAQEKKLSHQTGLKLGIGFNGSVGMGSGAYHLSYHPNKKMWLGLEAGITSSYWFRLNGKVNTTPHYGVHVGTQIGYTFFEKYRLFSRIGYLSEAIHGDMWQAGFGYSIKKERTELQFLLSRDLAQDLYNPSISTPYGEIRYYDSYFSFSVSYLRRL